MTAVPVETKDKEKRTHAAGVNVQLALSEKVQEQSNIVLSHMPVFAIKPVKPGSLWLP